MSRFAIKIGDKELLGCDIKHTYEDFNDEKLIAVLKEVISMLEAPTLEDPDLDKPFTPPDESLLNCLDYPNPPSPNNSFDLSTFIIMCG